MRINLTFEFENSADVLLATELLNVAACALDNERDASAVFDADEFSSAVAPPEPAPEPAPTATVKKGRGRPAKAKPAEVTAAAKGAEVLDALKASVAVENTASPVLGVADVLPDATPPAPAVQGAITNGQELQQYILSLVHQKRLDPVAVKAKVYPKYNVVRSLDLTPEQVPLAKADVDSMLKGGEPETKNDLDL